MARSPILPTIVRTAYRLRRRIKSKLGHSVPERTDEQIDAFVVWFLFSMRLKWHGRVNAAFDRRHGTDTASEVALTAAGVPSDMARRGNGVYRPFWASHFSAAMASLGIDFRRYTFLDLGSGKGKLLLLASHYPFRRIIGVEFAPLLHDIAVKNVAAYRHKKQKCRDVEAVLGDATAYVLPAGPIVCLIFNSFEPQTMQVVLNNIARDAASEKREVIVLYANVRDVSEMHEAFNALQGLSLLRRTPNLVVLGNDLVRLSLGYQPMPGYQEPKATAVRHGGIAPAGGASGSPFGRA